MVLLCMPLSSADILAAVAAVWAMMWQALPNLECPLDSGVLLLCLRPSHAASSSPSTDKWAMGWQNVLIKECILDLKRCRLASRYHLLPSRLQALAWEP